jgi:cyclohexadienyl dehydratase
MGAKWLLHASLVALALAPLAGSSEPEPASLVEESTLVDRVLTLEDQRLALMPAVAAWKWQHHTAVSDPARERIVIRGSAQLAEPLGLDPVPIERLFELQIRLARDVESASEEGWHRHGFTFPAPVPDLARELRPRLDRLTGELLRALYLAAPVLSRQGFASRYASLAQSRLRAAGWTTATRGELLVILGAIRTKPAASGEHPASTLARIRAAGVLRIGTTGDYAPLSEEEGGRLAGSDIELARALAQSLAVAPMFVRTSWPTLLDDLRRGEFDVAIGGISATPARAAAAALSIPYRSGGKTLIARCADAGRFTSLAAIDQPGVRVIENPGGTNEEYARTHLARAHIRLFPNNAAIFDELLADRADVMITDDTEVELQTRRHPQLCRTLPGTLTHADKVILMQRDPALIDAVNGWLRLRLRASRR